MIDASLSLIRSLSTYCDLYCLFELRSYEPNKLGINSRLRKNLTAGTELVEIKQFEKYLPLHKTYVLDRPKSTPSHLFQLLQQQIAVCNLIHRIKPDVIFCFNELPFEFGPFIMLNRKKISMIIHDPIFHSGVSRLFCLNLLRRFTLLFVKKIVLLNDTQRTEFMDKYNIKEEQIYRISLSVYEYLTNFICENVDRVIQEKTFKILFFGRITPYKGINSLLDAYSSIVNSGINDIELTIAGSGSFDFDISPYQKIKGVHFINEYIPDQILSHLINRCDVVVCPYVDATQSGVVMSAFALCKPVIATHVGGLAEMITHEKTGLIIPPKDITALTNAILLLYNNPELLLQMSVHIKEEFYTGKNSWDMTAKNLISYFQALQIKG